MEKKICELITAGVFAAKRGLRCGLLQATKDFSNKVRWNHFDFNLVDLKAFTAAECEHRWCEVVRTVFRRVDFKV